VLKGNHLARVESWIHNRLLDSSAVAVLVGKRVFPVFVPQGSNNLPAITYQRMATERQGQMRGTDRMVKAMISINCWATDYPTTKTLSENVRLCLDGFGGEAGDFQIRKIFLAGESDAYDPPNAGEDSPQVFRTQLDFQVDHIEAQSLAPRA
jgi:hypothetical protein